MVQLLVSVLSLVISVATLLQVLNRKNTGSDRTYLVSRQIDGLTIQRVE
jgi:hypothetical protein